MNHQTQRYAGFWIRAAAAIIDTIIMLAITTPLLFAVYGSSYFVNSANVVIFGPADFLISWVLPAIAVILFWRFKQATPGKLAVSAKIVDAKTGGKPSIGQWVIRYIGYFVSALPLCIGFIWAAFDPRKQTWHDKIAGTVVVRATP